MFSSTYTSNPLPSFPSSSSYPPLPLFVDPENAFAIASNTHLHEPLAVLPFMPTQAPTPDTVTNLTVADCAAMLQKDDANGINGVHCGTSISNFLIPKKPAKKDRHSKIHTSHGFRDRRVRLSSEIARKFFDLQDMLEYDKPSNTLEWLFTKSENAIKELARSKHSCSGDDKCFCFSSELRLQGVDSSLVGAARERKEKEDVCVQSKKESREKARARARQRTSSKMCSNNATSNPKILHQVMPPIDHQPHLLGSEAPRDGFDVIQDSIVLKRNLKPSLLCSHHHHHQNLAIPMEASFNNSDYHSFPNSPQNWDTSGAINGHSNFCGIACSMNLSKELQIFGKHCEECTSQR